MTSAESIARVLRDFDYIHHGKVSNKLEAEFSLHE